MNNYTNSDYLQHFGVKGMKWGVRRYRSYPGSYTKAGVKRFDKSLEEYEVAKAMKTNLKEQRKIHKSNSFTYNQSIKDHDPIPINVKDAKGAIASFKQDEKRAKAQLKKDYKHLKQDKLADQGKELYSQGYRITNNAGTKLVGLGTTGASVAAYLYSNRLLDANSAKQLAVISGATATVGAGMSFVNAFRDRKLRAYYGHTSNY